MIPGTLLYYHGAGPAWRGGWRLCVAVAVGRKWARLIDVGNLGVYRVHLREFERCKVLAFDTRRTEHLIDVMGKRQEGWLGTLNDDQHSRADEIIDAVAPAPISSGTTFSERTFQRDTTKATLVRRRRPRGALA